MKRAFAGVFLILHALAHALPGMRASEWAMRQGASGGDAATLAGMTTLAMVTVAWASATGGLLAAGAGLLGLDPWRRVWRGSLIAGLAGSFGVLAAGAGRDVLIAVFVNVVVAVVFWRHERRGPESPRPVAARARGRGRLIANALVGALIVYATAVVVTRPWTVGWGSRPSEWTRPLPGDEFLKPERVLIQHSISIDAAPAAVWPWLVQIGHDRGGFYSYSWLENLFGLRIRNATRVVPEWQDLRAGDFISAVPEDWMGGRFRDSAGWRVLRADPDRVMVLQNWGAFVLEPDGPNRTRLIVRMGIGSRGWIPLRWGDLLIGEPAHFIMERKMLLTLRDRAESTETGSTGG